MTASPPDPRAQARRYGDSFADVYDAWYSGCGTDVRNDATPSGADVAGVVELARRFPSGDVLELGAGTGRLTLPLARAVAPRRVAALDASTAMLDRLRAKLASGATCDDVPANVDVVVGDMSDDDAVPHGRFSLVVVSYNTLFNLPDEAAQRRCLATVAGRLTVDGACVIDCFVPVDDPAPLGVSIDRRNGVRVVTATFTDPVRRVVSGVTEEHRESGTVLRPWHVAYAPPELLDDMARSAGLRLAQRHGGWDGEPFDDSSARHVSLYVRARTF